MNPGRGLHIRSHLFSALSFHVAILPDRSTHFCSHCLLNFRYMLIIYFFLNRFLTLTQQRHPSHVAPASSVSMSHTINNDNIVSRKNRHIFQDILSCFYHSNSYKRELIFAQRTHFSYHPRILFAILHNSCQPSCSIKTSSTSVEKDSKVTPI